jgi:hypothetical protein
MIAMFPLRVGRGGGGDYVEQETGACNEGTEKTFETRFVCFSSNSRAQRLLRR